jgi:serine/threonine-protein kinase
MADSEATIPPAMVAAIGSSVMQGLHAAHEAVDHKGRPLGIIHRDVSPHNVMLGSDGIVRVVDFGVAKATGRTHTTRDGKIKGKLAYMAPEQLLGQDVDRRADIFAAGALLWELSTGRRLFHGASEGEVLHRVLEDTIPPPGTYNPRVTPAFDAVVLKALERDPARRFETAEAMAHALEAAAPPVPMRELATWLRTTCAKPLAERATLLADVRTGVVEGLGLVPQDLTTATAVETGRVTGPTITSPLRRRAWTAGVIATLCAGALVIVWRVRGPHPAAVAAAPPAATEAVASLASGDAAASVAELPASSPSAEAIALAPPTGTPRVEPSSVPAPRPRGSRRGTGKGASPKPTATPTTPIYSRD